MTFKIFAKVIALALTASLMAGPALAQPKPLVLGHVATAEIAGAFMASSEGYFKDAGLPVELKLIPLNPSMPPALIICNTRCTSSRLLRLRALWCVLKLSLEGCDAASTCRIESRCWS